MGSRGMSSSTLCRAARPRFSHSERRLHARSRASSRRLTVGASATKPVCSSTQSSAFPPTFVTTAGRAHHMASTSASGRPSQREGRTSRLFSLHICVTSSHVPTKADRRQLQAVSQSPEARLRGSAAVQIGLDAADCASVGDPERETARPGPWPRDPIVRHTPVSPHHSSVGHGGICSAATLYGFRMRTA